MISIIIPFYNEEKNITLLHKELSSVLKQHKYEYEILFIDDGSADDSRKEVEDISQKDEHVHLLFHRKRFGKGSALQTGLDRKKEILSSSWMLTCKMTLTIFPHSSKKLRKDMTL